jgi:hypothetical protein
MCSNRDWFYQFTQLTNPINIVLADKYLIQGTGVGCITIQMKGGRRWHCIVPEDVLYVPKLHRNLLSVPQLLHCGTDVHFTKKQCKIFDKQGMLTCEGSLRGTLFPMPIHVIVPESAHVTMVKLDTFPVEGDQIPHADSTLAM